MHALRVRALVRRRVDEGENLRTVADDLAIPLTTVTRWVAGQTQTDLRQPARCWRCDDEAIPVGKTEPYAYLLGQYLGDGHLVASARVPVLRIYACTDYPRVMTDIGESTMAVRESPPGRVVSARSHRMVGVQSYWKHWRCLFPQHGPGKKHKRPIELADWQAAIVGEHPWPLIRGLIHSDGCRAINRVITRGKSYSYPRYFFANESRDILAIMGDALDRVGVQWRFNRPNSISIAQAASVELVDRHVGPKA
jgi:hypothetical protein